MPKINAKNSLFVLSLCVLTGAGDCWEKQSPVAKTAPMNLPKPPTEPPAPTPPPPAGSINTNTPQDDAAPPAPPVGSIDTNTPQDDAAPPAPPAGSTNSQRPNSKQSVLQGRMDQLNGAQQTASIPTRPFSWDNYAEPPHNSTRNETSQSWEAYIVENPGTSAVGGTGLVYLFGRGIASLFPSGNAVVPPSDDAAGNSSSDTDQSPKGSKPPSDPNSGTKLGRGASTITGAVAGFGGYALSAGLPLAKLLSLADPTTISAWILGGAAVGEFVYTGYVWYFSQPESEGGSTSGTRTETATETTTPAETDTQTQVQALLEEVGVLLVAASTDDDGEVDGAEMDGAEMVSHAITIREKLDKAARLLREALKPPSTAMLVEVDEEEEAQQAVLGGLRQRINQLQTQAEQIFELAAAYEAAIPEDGDVAAKSPPADGTGDTENEVQPTGDEEQVVPTNNGNRFTRAARWLWNRLTGSTTSPASTVEQQVRRFEADAAREGANQQTLGGRAGALRRDIRSAGLDKGEEDTLIKRVNDAVGSVPAVPLPTSPVSPAVSGTPEGTPDRSTFQVTGSPTVYVPPTEDELAQMRDELVEQIEALRAEYEIVNAEWARILKLLMDKEWTVSADPDAVSALDVVPESLRNASARAASDIPSLAVQDVNEARTIIQKANSELMSAKKQLAEAESKHAQSDVRGARSGTTEEEGASLQQAAEIEELEQRLAAAEKLVVDLGDVPDIGARTMQLGEATKALASKQYSRFNKLIKNASRPVDATSSPARSSVSTSSSHSDGSDQMTATSSSSSSAPVVQTPALLDVTAEVLKEVREHVAVAEALGRGVNRDSSLSDVQSAYDRVGNALSAIEQIQTTHLRNKKIQKAVDDVKQVRAGVQRILDPKLDREKKAQQKKAAKTKQAVLHAAASSSSPVGNEAEYEKLLEGNKKLDPLMAEALAPLPPPVSLEVTSLNSITLGNQEFKIINGALIIREQLTVEQLKQLTAMFNRGELSSLTGFVATRFLGSGHSHVSSFGVFLRSLAKAPNLSKVTINKNEFTPEHIALLIASLPKVRHLNLRNNRIGEEGAAALAEAVKGHTGLKELMLCGNPIGNDGADSIVQATTHTFVNLIIMIGCGIDQTLAGVRGQMTIVEKLDENAAAEHVEAAAAVDDLLNEDSDEGGESNNVSQLVMGAMGVVAGQKTIVRYPPPDNYDPSSSLMELSRAGSGGVEEENSDAPIVQLWSPQPQTNSTGEGSGSSSSTKKKAGILTAHGTEGGYDFSGVAAMLVAEAAKDTSTPVSASSVFYTPETAGDTPSSVIVDGSSSRLAGEDAVASLLSQFEAESSPMTAEQQFYHQLSTQREDSDVIDFRALLVDEEGNVLPDRVNEVLARLRNTQNPVTSLDISGNKKLAAFSRNRINAALVKHPGSTLITD